jgi:hypothetical protein
MKQQRAYIRNYTVPWCRFHLWLWKQSRLVSLTLGLGQKRYSLNISR